MDMMNESVLRRDERAIFALRALYRRHGYTRFKMSRFEEYGLYAANRDFLVSERMITFTDLSGTLMALKPDVTISIIKNTREGETGVRKVYYNENVFRAAQGETAFKEIMQTGLECIGQVDLSHICEVVALAAESLEAISSENVLAISHLGYVSGLLEAAGLPKERYGEVLTCAREKNTSRMEALCAGLADSALPLLSALIGLTGPLAEVLPRLKELCANGDMAQAWMELDALNAALTRAGLSQKVRLDFSVVNDMGYYNGLVFQGFVQGIPVGVLSGGQYDRLVEKMGKSGKAIGFAVYLDALDYLDSEEAAEQPLPRNDGYLNVALPKGRLGEKVYAMFAKAGFPCPSLLEKSRKLIFENHEAGVRYFWVKPTDVAIYVERGAADVGVAGKDILLEYAPDVFELLDLNVGKCRMAVAAKKGFTDNGERTLRVATKFPRIASRHYAAQSRDIDIINLHGSIEIAPILDLSDVIVDIVETGETLRENDLEPVETIVPISARLVANKSGYRFKEAQMRRLMQGLTDVLNAKE